MREEQGRGNSLYRKDHPPQGQAFTQPEPPVYFGMVFCLGRSNCIRSGRQGMDGRPSNLLKSNILDRGNNLASVILAARAPQGSIEFLKSPGAAKSAPGSLESYPVLQVPKSPQ